MTQKSISWLERVILRGIEGIIGDQYLANAITGPGLTGMEDYFESKYMAEQIFAQCRGWGF